MPPIFFLLVIRLFFALFLLSRSCQFSVLLVVAPFGLPVWSSQPPYSVHPHHFFFLPSLTDSEPPFFRVIPVTSRCDFTRLQSGVAAYYTSCRCFPPSPPPMCCPGHNGSSLYFLPASLLPFFLPRLPYWASRCPGFFFSNGNRPRSFVRFFGPFRGLK